MATTVTKDGNLTGSSYWKLRVTCTYDYCIYEGVPAYSFAVTLSRYANKKDTSGYDARKDTSTFTLSNGVTSQTYTGTPTWSHTNTAGQVRTLVSNTKYVKLTKEPQIITITASNKHPSGTMGGTSSITSSDPLTINIPALPQYNVYFDTQGIGIAPETQLIFWGDLAEQPIPPRFSDNIVEGWYEEQECINEFNFENTFITEDIVLYAKWILYIPHVWCKVNGEWISGDLLTKMNGEILTPIKRKVKISGNWIDF